MHSLRSIRNRPLAFDILEDRIVPATYQWTGADSANSWSWNDAGNWTPISGAGTFPNAVGDVAQFTGAYTATQLPVITSAITVGEIDFGGPTFAGNFGVTLTKTAGGLTLKNTSGPAVINVLAGGNTSTQTITIATLASGLVAASGGVTVNQNAANLNLTISVPIKTGSFGEYATVSAGTLLQNDNAATASLGPTSTFTVNSGGTLAIGSTANLAVAQNNLGLGTITLNAGSTLKVNNANDPASLSNNIVFGPSANVILSGAPILFLGGAITLNGNDTLKVNSAVPASLAPLLTTIADTIVGTGTDTNKLTIGTAGTGILAVGDVTFAGSSPIVLAGKAITLASGSSYPGGADATPTFTVDTPTSITNVLGGTVSALTIAGSSTLTLTGANTYTGLTTVNGGTLLADGSLAASAGVSVALGATLGGNGSVSNLTLGPGNVALDLASAAAYDAFAVAGSLNLAGATLNLSVGTVDDGDAFTIFAVAGTDPAARTGTFVNLPSSGSTLTIGSRTFAIDYAGGDGNDVVLTAQPSSAGPTVVSTVLNGGIPAIDSTLAGNQHSLVENVVYSFSQAVSLSAADFTLVNVGGSTFAPTVTVTSSNSTSSDTVWTVTFGGAGVNSATHSIGDGAYRLILSGTSGLSNTYDFFRLLGDMDGDGTVSAADFSTLIGAFLRPSDDPLFLGADDFDGDGTIGASDLSQFTANFLHTVPVSGGGT